MTSARYCVIGNPIAHSKSPQIHAMFAEQTGQVLSYQQQLADLDGFAACVETLLQQGYAGANVTVPFKLEAYQLAHHRSPRALAAAAVNTLKFIDGEIHADNTDGLGLVNDIQLHAGLHLTGKRILLIGAGGAARGAILPLLEQNPASLSLVNRSADKALALVTELSRSALVPTALSSRLQAVHFADLKPEFDLIINASSASLQGELPPVSAAVLAHADLVYDMMYGTRLSPFLQLAQQHGAPVRDGLGMLVEQAAAAFHWWRGVQPDTVRVLRSLRTALELAQ